MSFHWPPGWLPPYHGAAPPMPQNMSINQQQWQRGSWQFNPAYNWQRYSVPQMQWMAASAWNYGAHHMHQPPPANFNPYKKVIKPPSAEYLAMKVSDNGLDLHGMVPLQNPDDNAENPPQTPWIWNPATLTHDAPAESARRAAAVAAAAAATDRAQDRSSSDSQLARSNSAPATRPRHATDPSPLSSHPSQPNASTSNGSSPLKPTFSSKIIRVPEHYTHPSNASASGDSLARRMEHLSTSRPASLGRQSSMPSIYSDSKHSSSISGAQLSDEPMSILSPLVIPITPKPPTRHPITRGATYPNIGSHPGLDTISEAPPVPHSQMSSRPRETPTETYVPQSAPASQQSFTRPMASRSETYPRSAAPSVFRDAPLQDRPNLRNPTAQDSYRSSHRPSTVQQHTPPDLEAYLVPRQTSPRPSTPRRPIEIYAPTPPPQRSASFDYIPTRHSSSHQSSPTRTTHTTRPSPPEPSRSPKHTPPTLPTDYPITPVSLRRTGAPASPYTYDEERPKPVKPVRIHTPVGLPPVQRRRLGYWNRRGDHCTDEGYIVFAPPELAFPDELSTYPERDYQDDLGFRVAFDSKRPELPESLPRHGQPAEKPYKTFLIYT